MRSWITPRIRTISAQLTFETRHTATLTSQRIAGDYTGHMLSHWHPQFSASLETGIRDLALVLIQRFDWITYSSCEGHYYDDLAILPVQRQVGLLPRSKEEGEMIY